MQVLRTVRGDVPIDGIGHTQPHEHVLSNLAATNQQQGTVLASDEQIRLDNYYETRRHHSTIDLTMVSIEDAVEELNRYAAAGGDAVVDATSRGIGRDPDGLREVSGQTGVHIVMGSGYYHHDYHPSDLAGASREQVAEEIRRDIVDGVGDTRIRSGVIGEIGLGWPIDPTERLVLEAAADAQRATGAALLVHPGRDTAAPQAAIDIVRDAGGDTGRVIMSHIDRTLFDLGSMLRLAESGCYLEFDLFGQESSYYPLADIDMPNDATRVDYLAALIAHGFGQRLLVAQDICSRTHLQKYGGEGYGHLIRNVVPLMRRKGIAEAALLDMTTNNPRRALGIPT